MNVVSCLVANGGRAHRSTILRAGVTVWELRRALEVGNVERCARGIYRLTADLSSDDLDLAVQATRGVVSHDTAAAMHGLDCVHHIGRHLTVPQGSRAAYPGYTMHHERIIGGICMVSGLPVTSLLQTVIGCAKICSLRDAVVITDSALRAGLSYDLLRRHSAQLRGPNSGNVREVVRAGDPKAGSVAESLARVLFIEGGLPRPLTQQAFEDLYRSDFLWPRHRVVVEIDGYEFHKDKQSFARDRRITNVLLLHGWLVLRFTWEDVTEDPAYVLDSVRTALTSRDPLHNCNE